MLKITCLFDIDLIGVLKGVSDLNTVVGKTSNREIKKRDIQLVDQGKVQVRMTLWGNDVSLQFVKCFIGNKEKFCINDLI